MDAEVPSIRYSERKPDPSAYLALFETTGWNAMYRCTERDLEASLRSSWYWISAHHGETLVGTGRLVSDGVLYAVVFDMVVAPAWRGRGVGAAILGRLLTRCDRAGIRDVLLFAAQGTEGFYRRHGFVPRPAQAPGMILRRVPAGDRAGAGAPRT
jgi:GNAT superfamily N-acetyltransferase